MAGKRAETLEIQDMIRVMRRERSDRAIAAHAGVDRKTVAKYRAIATRYGWLGETMPDAATIEKALAGPSPTTSTGPSSSVEPYRVRVEELMAQGTKGVAIHRLLSEGGFGGSYCAVKRFMKTLRRREPEVFVRVEVAAGSEAQVDFGYVGWFRDVISGILRRAWAFVMVLSYSRHLYVELVFDQSVPTWLRLHANAFAFFGGVPGSIVLDNLKAGIVKACFCEPAVQRTYGDFASHHGFMIRPCRPRTPQHKGKVESGVKYVEINALAGREFRDLAEANTYLRGWIEETAGVRVHGTTKKRPLDVFERFERSALQVLPSDALPLSEWKQARVARDGYVVYDQAYYSVPYRLAGRKLWLCNTGRTLDVFDRFLLVATHVLAKERGARQTVTAHLPPTKTGWAAETPEWCLEQALEIGPSVRAIVEELLAERPADRLPAARRLIGLRKKYTPGRIEAACARALAHGETSCLTVRKILESGYERETVVPVELLATVLPSRYARAAGEYFVLEGGEASCPSQRN